VLPFEDFNQRQSQEERMNSSGVVRPAGIAAIAWLWIAGGILLLISALLTWAVLSLFESALPVAGASGSLPVEFDLLSMLQSQAGVLVWTQVAMGVVSIYAGAGLLKLRAWARTAIEVLTWLSLVYVLGNGVYFSYTWESIVADLAKQLMVDSDALRITGYVTVATVTVVFAVPFGFMLKYLRSSLVRQAVADVHRN
jgi:hypothetical protein